MIARIVLALLVALLVGCSSTGPPTPSPGSMDDVIANLVLQDARVHSLTSGNAGCPSSDLHDNALYLEVALGSQSVLHRIHLLRWRRAADYEAGKATFEACVEEYRALNPGAQVSTLEVAPWRAFGPAWNDMLKTTLKQALLATGGG